MLSPAPGGRPQVPSSLPSPCPGLGGPRLPTLPSLAFVLPSGLVAKSCCCAKCSPHSGLVSLERAEVRWYSRNCHLARLPAAFFVLTPSDRTLAPTQGPIPLVTQSPSSTPPPARVQCQASPGLTWQQWALSLAGTSLSTFHLLCIQTTCVPISSVP